MKFNNKSLPYPIFDASDLGRDDYVCEFGYKAEIEELAIDQGSGKISLKVNHDCEITELSDLVDKGVAAYAIKVSSVITNTMKIIISSNGNEQTQLMNASDFYGRVEMTPMLVALNRTDHYTSQFLNEEFQDVVFSLAPGDVLAIGDKIERTFEFSGAKFESLVKAILSKDIEDNAYEIDVEGNFIRILMGEKLFMAWNALKEMHLIRPLLAMSIYKDCFLIALDEYAKNEESRDRKWAYALTRKIDELPMVVELDKDTSLSDLNTYAQLILEKEGASKLSQVIESEA